MTWVYYAFNNGQDQLARVYKSQDDSRKDVADRIWEQVPDAEIIGEDIEFLHITEGWES